METKEAGDRLAQRWKEARLTIRLGVPAERLDQFKQRFNAHLGPDIREYFEAVNGMALGEMDPDCHIRFWPLEEVKPIQEEVDAPWVAQYTGYYLFADYLLWSHAYAIDLNPAGQGAIVMVGGKTPHPVAPSFADFVCMYLDRIEQLFPHQEACPG